MESSKGFFCGSPENLTAGLWTLMIRILTPQRPGNFEDLTVTPAIQVQTLPLEGPMILRVAIYFSNDIS